MASRSVLLKAWFGMDFSDRTIQNCSVFRQCRYSAILTAQHITCCSALHTYWAGEMRHSYSGTAWPWSSVSGLGIWPWHVSCRAWGTSQIALEITYLQCSNCCTHSKEQPTTLERYTSVQGADSEGTSPSSQGLVLQRTIPLCQQSSQLANIMVQDVLLRSSMKGFIYHIHQIYIELIQRLRPYPLHSTTQHITAVNNLDQLKRKVKPAKYTLFKSPNRASSGNGNPECGPESYMPIGRRPFWDFWECSRRLSRSTVGIPRPLLSRFNFHNVWTQIWPGSQYCSGSCRRTS